MITNSELKKKWRHRLYKVIFYVLLIAVVVASSLFIIDGEGWWFLIGGVIGLFVIDLIHYEGVIYIIYGNGGNSIFRKIVNFLVELYSNSEFKIKGNMPNKKKIILIIQKLFFKYIRFQKEKRVGRVKFIIMWIILIVYSGVFANLVSSESILFLSIQIVLIVLFIEKLIKRVQDMNTSGWYLLFPIYNGLLFLFCFILPGTKGLNKYDDNYEGNKLKGDDIIAEIELDRSALGNKMKCEGNTIFFDKNAKIGDRYVVKGGGSESKSGGVKGDLIYEIGNILDK